MQVVEVPAHESFSTKLDRALVKKKKKKKEPQANSHILAKKLTDEWADLFHSIFKWFCGKEMKRSLMHNKAALPKNKKVDSITI